MPVLYVSNAVAVTRGAEALHAAGLVVSHRRRWRSTWTSGRVEYGQLLPLYKSCCLHSFAVK